MATSAITENARVFRTRFFFPSTGWWYQTHTVETIRTVGYTAYAGVGGAKEAADAAAGAGVVATVNRDSPGLYSVLVETDTVGALTPE